MSTTSLWVTLAPLYETLRRQPVPLSLLTRPPDWLTAKSVYATENFCNKRAISLTTWLRLPHLSSSFSISDVSVDKIKFCAVFIWTVLWRNCPSLAIALNI
ncbi:MAG: hypothetical protein V7K21_24640 [Nostoc sp.]|uniref:hypothetical protein n=1 Tax=Nostoc sp. TaxID=1180 RepID=UPI002FFB1344